MINVQNPRIRAVLDRLTGSPPNTQLPRLDNRQLTFTYPAEPAWIDPAETAWRSSNSINGTQLFAQDDGGGVTLTFDRGGSLAIADEGRYYQSIAVNLSGGTVSPITIAAFMRITDAGGTVRTYRIQIADQVNPSIVAYGPYYIPAGIVFAIGNFVNGGAGDTMAINAFGLVHQIGAPTPLPPGPRGAT